MNRETHEILDELLVIRSQDGERSAIELLVERWQPRLAAHVRNVVRSDQATADIVQDAWLAIFRGLRRLKDPAAFRSWAFQIAHRQAVNWVRTQSKERTHRADIESQQNIATTSEDCENHVEELQQAITSLEPEQRTLLRMFYHEGLTLREISHVVGVPVGTLKHRLFTLRQRLKTLIERERNDVTKY